MSKASTAPITFSDRSRSSVGGLGEESNVDAHFSRLLGVIQLLEQMAEAPSGFDATRMSAALELLSEVIQASVRELYPLSMKKTLDNSQSFIAPAAQSERESGVADIGDASKVRSDNYGRTVRLHRTSGQAGRRDAGGANA